jgi:hypothetical protein
MVGAVAKTVILSEETAQNLIEAHASLAAWYYQLSDALRRAGAPVEAPSEEQRRAFVTQLATHFPELAAVARAITAPRPYLPPPAAVGDPPAAAAGEPSPAATLPYPPPVVDPSRVKYE